MRNPNSKRGPSWLALLGIKFTDSQNLSSKGHPIKYYISSCHASRASLEITIFMYARSGVVMISLLGDASRMRAKICNK